MRLSFAVLVLVLAGCAGEATPRAASTRGPVAVTSEELLGARPSAVIVLRPRALRRDPVFGPLVRSVLLLASARSETPLGVRTLEVLETADEVTLVLGRERDGGLVVVRGVRGDVDPRRLTDEHGRPMFSDDPARRLKDGETRDPGAAERPALWVLPERTWIVAVGAARASTRHALEPGARPLALADGEELATLRVDGPSLVRAVTGLRGALRPIGHRLRSAAVSLLPNGGGVRSVLDYESGEAAGEAEALIARILGLVRDKPGWLWVRSVAVARRGDALEASATLPPGVLASLVSVTPADLAQ